MYCVSCKKILWTKIKLLEKRYKKLLLKIKNSTKHALLKFKMNKIINKFLLTGDKFMLELNLK